MKTSSRFRSCLGCFVLAASGCRRPAPVEVRAPSVASPVEPLRFASFPDGNVAVADLASCTVTRVSADAEAWRVPIAGCREYLEIAVARDSSVFVRTAGSIISLGSDGHARWSHPSTTVPRAIAAPATTLGSMLVLATTPSSIAAFPHDAPEAWQFTLPTGETLVTSPVGSLGEGVVVLSQTATYFVGADGTIRGRRPHLAVLQH